MSGHIENRFKEALHQHSFFIERAVQTMSVTLTRQQERFRQIERQFKNLTDAWLADYQNRLSGFVSILRQVDPTRVLSRGYSIVRFGDRVLKESSTLELGANIHVQLAAGSIDARVTMLDGKGQQKLV